MRHIPDIHKIEEIVRRNNNKHRFSTNVQVITGRQKKLKKTISKLLNRLIVI